MQHWRIKKKNGIERLKALVAIVFEEIAVLTDVEAGINLIKKCFMVMRCPEDRKVTVAIFLLQKGVDDWWRLVENRWKEGNKPS